MKRKTWSIVLIVTGLVVLASVAQAKMIMIKPYVFTGSTPAGQTLDVSIEVFADSESHPPNYVQSITLISPTGANITIDPVAAWDEVLKQYFVSLPGSTFGGVIPSGTYSVRVTDAAGSITIPDVVSAAFLPIPVVTSPAIGATVTNMAPTFSWQYVTGARFYRVHLYDMLDGQWIYSNAEGHKLETSRASAVIPKGVLKPGRSYRMRIEARYDFPDLDKRSRNNWVNFTTSW